MIKYTSTKLYNPDIYNEKCRRIICPYENSNNLRWCCHTALSHSATAWGQGDNNYCPAHFFQQKKQEQVIIIVILQCKTMQRCLNFLALKNDNTIGSAGIYYYF